MAVKRFLLIRHGKTQGNLERRYIGDAEEPLCEEGLREIAFMIRDTSFFDSYPDFKPVGAVLSGPALRCRQTAALLFPDIRYSVCSFKEIDFGVFIGKNAGDLRGDKAYGRWLETGCMGDIPGGDSVSAFKARCCDEFLDIAEKCGEETTALVMHGGNIMAVLERFVLPKQDFYTYHVPNCGYFFCRYEDEALIIEAQGGPK
jgi:alpha-ribazole phosphatase